jgi:hypothetical protein
MTPKADRSPLTFVFGCSKVSEGLLAEFVTSGFIKEEKGQVRGSDTTPTPHPNEEEVFRDLFAT